MDHSLTTDTTTFFTAKYIRNSRAVAVLWGIFTVCAAILNVVVFINEQWVGDTPDSKGPGYFGLYRFCTVLTDRSTLLNDDVAEIILNNDDDRSEIVCRGTFYDFASILGGAFRASTIFVGISVIIAVLIVIAFLLFFFVKANSVFETCGTMQFLAGFCMAIGIVSFPAGWDHDEVRSICGADSDNYELGTCGVRWAFVLAVIVLFDFWVLGCLAFTLAHRDVKPPPHFHHHHQESHYMNPASIYKGEINPGFVGDTQSLTGSRKSINLQPVMMMPHPMASPEEFEPPPHYGRNQSPHRNPYGTSIQNFQL